MVLHVLVDVEEGRGRRVEAGQQLVDDDQELHLPRLLDEAPFHFLFEVFDLAHRRVFRLVEVRGKHFPIDVVFAKLLGEALAGFLALDVRRGRLVGGHDGALAGERGRLKHLVESAGRVDAVGNKQRVALPALQAVARLHVEHDVGDDLLQAILGAQHTAHRAPSLLELGFRKVCQASGLGLEPLVDLRLGREFLIDVARLVAQIEHDTVAHRLVVLVRVDVRPEYLDAARLVGLEQRGPGEADQRRFRQQRLHGLMELAGLGSVALVHEDEDLAFGAEALGQARLDLFDIELDVTGAGFLA